MPGFAETLSAKEITALVDYIYSPSAAPIVWGLPEINSSHIQHNDESKLPNRPVFEVADLLNLFLVVELGFAQ